MIEAILGVALVALPALFVLIVVIPAMWIIADIWLANRDGSWDDPD